MAADNLLLDALWHSRTRAQAILREDGAVIDANPAFEQLFALGAMRSSTPPIGQLLPDVWAAVLSGRLTTDTVVYLELGLPCGKCCMDLQLATLPSRPEGAVWLLELSPHLDAPKLPLSLTSGKLPPPQCRACIVKDVAAAANAASHPDASLRVALELLARFLDAKIAHAFIAQDGPGEALVSSQVWVGPTDSAYATLRQVTEQQRYRRGVGFPGRVLERRSPIWIADLARDSDHLQCEVQFDTRPHITEVAPEDVLRLGSALQAGLRSLFGFPILIDDEVVAVLEFFSTARALPRENVVDLAREIGAQVGHVVARKRAEQALGSALRAANTANHAKSAFLASMSHEIRTPLTAIVGFTELMQRDNALSIRQRDNLETVIRSSQHLVELLDDVLELARIEAGREELKLGNVELGEMVKTLRGMFKARTSARGLHYIVETTTDLPRWVRTDEGKFRQILINLTNNAIKFTAEGTIRVRFSRTHDVAPKLVVDVMDTGLGIDDDARDRIFEAFERTSREEFTEGVGLGLQISRKFARLLGGDITFESAENVGSHFSLSLPLVLPIGPIDVGRGAFTLDASMAPPLVLVADEDATSRAFIGRALQEAGFKVRTAIDLDQALVILRTARPEVVILDLGSDPLRGIAALARMRVEGPTHTTLIAVSTHVLQTSRDGVMQAGADGFIPKPFRIKTLLDALRDAPSVQRATSNAALPAQARLSATPDHEELSRRAGQLPAQLLDKLRLHIHQAEMDELVELGGQVRALDPVLAAHTRELLEAFDYDGLAALFDQASS